MSTMTMSPDAMEVRFLDGSVFDGLVVGLDKTLEAFRKFSEAMREERCDYSWLFESQCAHCLGHVADWEVTPKRKVVEER